MAIEFFSAKKLLLFVILVGGFTLVIFIKLISSSGLFEIGTLPSTETDLTVKNLTNSSNKCWLNEDSVIIKKCQFCSSRPECINASFIETVECKYTGIVYRSCVISEADFWIFLSYQFLFAVIGLSILRHKRNQFHKKLMIKIQKQLDSVV